MAFTIRKLSPKQGYTVEGKIYISRDGSRIVDRTDPEVGSLFATPGDVISMDDAARLGLVKESRPAATKESKPAATKARKRSKAD